MTAPPGLYEQVLAAASGAVPSPKPPRASAAVVLWRRSGRGIEIYWIRRGRTLPFMAGWQSFPGGGLDRTDAELPVVGTPFHPAPGLPTSPSPEASSPLDDDLAPGIAACALRELGEEVGVRLDAARLRFAGRWLTPPFGAARFDNRFFLAEWQPEDGEPTIVSAECEAGEWIAPALARALMESGKLLAAPPILHLCRVLAEDGPDDSRARLLDTREANLGPLRRIELRPHLLLFPLAAATLPPATHTNAYVLGSGDCVLVDPGSPFAAENERLVAALAAAREQLGRRVTEIWLTHHHPDHVGGVETLRRALAVPVAAHSATAERLAEQGIAIDRLLDADQRVELAGDPPVRLRLHHTPGHARGHLAIELEERGDLICGDLVAGVGTIVIDPPEGDMDDYLASLERMRGRGFRTLFPAHGAPILNVDAKLDEYIAHRLEREEQVLACWREGRRLPEQMMATVYPDVPEAVWPLAARQIVAHLERLERHGRLD